MVDRGILREREISPMWAADGCGGRAMSTRVSMRSFVQQGGLRPPMSIDHVVGVVGITTVREAT